MAQRGIREFDAKRILAKFLPFYSAHRIKYSGNILLVDENTNLTKQNQKWLKEKLVVKPDQLFGKRGKHNLVLLGADLKQATKFLKENLGKSVTVGKTEGKLTHFLVEPFVKHDIEYYVAIKTEREYDEVLFSTRGGVDVEDTFASMKTVKIPIENNGESDFTDILGDVKEKDTINDFLRALYKLFAELNFSFLEVNPFTIVNNEVIPLDTVAKLDDTAMFESGSKWGIKDFPTAFGKTMTKEEQFIKNLDENTGASLKLTMLNPKGRVWTLVAGGGASVIYADTISDLNFGTELANYGEYSGNPNDEETYLYTKTILDLMTREKNPKGKILLIGGGIANFTDVAKTFKGIIQALKEFKDKLKQHNVKIYVRRGGPNYEEGLDNMKKLGKELGIPLEVYGPETHMTKIVSMALK